MDPVPPIDPLDKLIAAFQGVTIKDPVPVPGGAQAVPDSSLANGWSPSSIGILVLWYRQIIRSTSGYSKPPGDALSDWERLYVPCDGVDWSAMSVKQRENQAIEVAGKVGIGHYPKVLYAFEWFDDNLKKPLRQEIKDGFVRG